jgi:hypothetical protein
MRFFLFLLVVVGLVACAPVSGQNDQPVETPTPTLSPTPTATIVWFPPTSTPTLVPTREIVPTPQPQLGLAEEILGDNFSDGTSWTTGRTSSGSAAYGSDRLTLAVSAPRGLVTSLRSQPDFADFYLEVTASLSLCRGADSYGLLLRGADEWNNYRWVISCDGRTRLERVRGGSFIPLVDWIPSLQIPPGAPVDINLAVWMYGPQMRFFIGGIEQFSARDPVFTSGSLGAFARAAADTPLTVSLSGLTVWSLDPAAIPTPTPQVGEP